MDIVTTCPQCQLELRFPPEVENTRQACPGCRHTFVVEAPAASPAPAHEPTRARRPSSPTTDANAFVAALMAVPPTVIVYAVCWLGSKDSRLVHIILSGSWVNVVSVYLASWAAMLLVLKYFGLQRQRRVLQLDLLPQELGDRISPSSAAVFSRYLDQLNAKLRGTFAVNRVTKLLRFYQSGRSPHEAASNLRALAEADAQSVESSYTFVKVLIWSIPIMGFIGTVLGIGQSVDGFSDTMQGTQQLEVIRTSLGDVTTGLAVAFNTTLVALVLSLFVMFPMSSLQRAEERLLGDIDDYLDEHLLRRLKSEVDEQHHGLELIRQSLTEQMQARRAELAELRTGLDAVVRSMGDRVIDGWKVVDERLERRERIAHERAQTLVAAFEASSRAVFDELTLNARARADEAQKLIGELASVGQRVEADAARTYGVQSDLGQKALLEAQQAIVALRERDRDEHKEIADTLSNAALELERAATELAKQTSGSASQIGELLGDLSRSVLLDSQQAIAALRERDREEHKEIAHALTRSAQELERATAELAKQSSGSASQVGELLGEVSRTMLLESQQALAALRERDRDEHREIARALQGSAQEMERATATLAREASGIGALVSDLSRKALIEAQQTIGTLRERDRDEQKEIARAVQRSAQEMERASAALAKEATGSTSQILALFRQMHGGMEAQAKTLVSELANQLERQTRELTTLQRGLSDGLVSFQSSLKTLEAELGSTIRDARARFDQEDQRVRAEVAEGWSAAQRSFDTSAQAFEAHAAGSTASMRELVETQQKLVDTISAQFAGALNEHREALDKSSGRELGAVAKECRKIVTALGRTADELQAQNNRLDGRSGKVADGNRSTSPVVADGNVRASSVVADGNPSASAVTADGNRGGSAVGADVSEVQSNDTPRPKPEPNKRPDSASQPSERPASEANEPPRPVPEPNEPPRPASEPNERARLASEPNEPPRPVSELNERPRPAPEPDERPRPVSGANERPRPTARTEPPRKPPQPRIGQPKRTSDTPEISRERPGFWRRLWRG